MLQLQQTAVWTYSAVLGISMLCSSTVVLTVNIECFDTTGYVSKADLKQFWPNQKVQVTGFNGGYSMGGLLCQCYY